MISFGSIADVPFLKRVVVTSPEDNKVAVLDYSGIQQRVRVLPGRPTDVLNVENKVYLLFEGNAPLQGKLVLLDTDTLTVSSISDGLNSPLGLAFSSGGLYTTVSAQSGDRMLVRLDALTGAVTVPVLQQYASQFINNMNRLVTDPYEPNRLYGTNRNFGNPMLGLVNLESGAIQYETRIPQEEATHIAFVPRYIIVAGSGFRQSVLEQIDFVDWRPQSSDGSPVAFKGAAASRDIVAVWADNFVSIGGTSTRLPEISRVQIPQLKPLNSGMIVTQDSSRVMMVSQNVGGPVLVATIGGIKFPGVPQAPGVEIAGRKPAPQAGGSVGSSVRAPAPQSNRPVVLQRSVADIEFDDANRGFLSDPITNSVNVYDQGGQPLAGFGNLDRVTSLTMHNSEMLAAFTGTGTIAAIKPETLAVERRCQSVSAQSMVSWNGDLFVAEPLRKVNLATCVLTGNGPDPLGYQIRLSDGAVPAGFFIDESAPVPYLNFGVDRTGHRFSAITGLPDGHIFPGSGHSVSYENPRRVAAKVGDQSNRVFVYDYAGDGSAIPISTITVDGAARVLRVEYQPGTGSLWVAAADLSDHVFLKIFPRSALAEPGAGTGDEPASVPVSTLLMPDPPRASEDRSPNPPPVVISESEVPPSTISSQQASNETPSVNAQEQVAPSQARQPRPTSKVDNRRTPPATIPKRKTIQRSQPVKKKRLYWLVPKK